MSNQNIAKVEILGKIYQVKCPPEEAASLQEAVTCLNGKMQAICDTKSVTGMDKITVLAALNLAHELIDLQKKTNNLASSINQRIHNLQNKIDQTLFLDETIEL